jgi:hypothetical protein
VDFEEFCAWVSKLKHKYREKNAAIIEGERAASESEQHAARSSKEPESAGKRAY